MRFSMSSQFTLIMPKYASHYLQDVAMFAKDSDSDSSSDDETSDADDVNCDCEEFSCNCIKKPLFEELSEKNIRIPGQASISDIKVFNKPLIVEVSDDKNKASDSKDDIDSND